MNTSDPRRATARGRLGAGAVVVIVLVALAVTVVIGMMRSTTAREPIEPTPVGEQTVVADAAVYVHVSGAVADPGLYRLTPGSRVFDAVAAAGGLQDDADAEAVNLARVVDDGEQVRVPRQGETTPAAAGTAADGRIDLNTADAATLEQLPRVGPAIAQRIMDWRESNGRFASVDELMAVPGIGEKMLAALRDLVTV